MIGNDEGQISLATIESAAGAAVGLGLLGLLYAGLGWLSSMRDALLVVFELPSFEQPNFVFGKLRDLVTLITVGLVLLLSVGVSGLVGRLSEDILEALDLGPALQSLMWVLAILIGLVASTILFLALFRLLADPHTPKGRFCAAHCWAPSASRSSSSSRGCCWRPPRASPRSRPSASR